MKKFSIIFYSLALIGFLFSVIVGLVALACELNHQESSFVYYFFGNTAGLGAAAMIFSYFMFIPAMSALAGIIELATGKTKRGVHIVNFIASILFEAVTIFLLIAAYSRALMFAAFLYCPCLIVGSFLGYKYAKNS